MASPTKLLRMEEVTFMLDEISKCVTNDDPPRNFFYVYLKQDILPSLDEDALDYKSIVRACLLAMNTESYQRFCKSSGLLYGYKNTLNDSGVIVSTQSDSDSEVGEEEPDLKNQCIIS
jgi:hypothetical protein